MERKHYLYTGLLGCAVALTFFLALVFAQYDNVYVETTFGVIVFLLYTQTPYFKENHGASPNSVFWAFIAFIVGISLGYFILWVTLALSFTVSGGPTLSV